MKQNKLLSLIAALLVAIMLVPSFAMAEETAAAATPSLSIPTDKQAFSVKLTGAKKGSSLDPEITVTVKDMPEGYTDASIAWTSASPDYVSITSAPQVITGAEPTSAVPNITIKDLCSGVTITGKLSYTDKDGHKWPEKASTSFTVTATQVDSKEIKFKEKTYTYQQYQVQPTEYTYPDYSYTIPYYEYFGNKIEWDDPDDSTYGQSGPVWSVNNTTVATVSSTGTVYFTGEPGEVTLTVATRDSTPKSASTTIKVVADEDDPTPAQPGESSYTFLGFRAQTINRVGTDSFSADSYLDKSPDWWEINVDPKYPNFNDALIWESTDTSVATVDAEGYVTVLKKGETEIKVKSRKNPDTVKASVKVVIDAEEEEEEDVIPYSTFEYAKETPTMLIGGRLDTQTYYLTRSPKKVSPKEKITYATSDPKVAIVDKDGVVTALAVGEVTITATTAYSGQSTQLTIKVTEKPDAETIEYDTFKFDTAELSLYPYVSGIGMIPSYNSANLVSHLIRDPDPTTQTVANLEKFVITSGDSAIAYVENNVVFARRTGEVTITARTSHSKQTAKITIKVLDPTAAPAEAFEDIWFYNESPLVLYTTKNVSFNQADLSKFIATKGGNDILSPDKYDLVSLDPGIAKLNGTTLIAVAPGETTVVATSHYGAKTAELKVVVKEEEELHVPYESVEFSISDLTLYAGENSPLSELNVSGYVVTDNKAINDTIVFDSTDKAVATVDSTGLVKAVKAGKATIIAKSKYGDKKAELKVTVKKDEEAYTQFTEFKFAWAEQTVYMTDGTVDLKALLATNPENWPTDIEPVIWSSSDMSVLKVDQSGKATLLKESEKAVTVTAETVLSKKKATIAITVMKAKPVLFTKIDSAVSEITLYEEDSYDLADLITTEPANATDRFVWASADTTIATVTYSKTSNKKGGKVTAVKEGTTFVTVSSYYDRSVSKAITVKVLPKAQKTFDALTFTSASYAVKKSAGEFDALPYIEFKPYYEDVDLTTLKWFSSDATVATVSNGKVTIVKTGITGEKATVTISVCAAYNPKATKSFELTIINDDTHYTKLTFIEPKAATAKFVEGANNNTFNAKNYLLEEPVDHPATFKDSLVWTSSDLNIARVNDDGKATLLKAGTVKITVRSKYDEKVTDTFTLTVTKGENPITEITLTQDTINLDWKANGEVAEKYFKNYLVFKPVDYTDKVKWTTSDPTIVDVVGNNNILKIYKPGTVKLTVRSTEKAVTKSFTVTVAKEPLTSIKFIADVPTQLHYGQTGANGLDLKKYLVTEPSYYAEDAYSDDLCWVCDNPQYAKVSDNGIVEYVAPGATVTIAVCDAAGKVAPASIKLATTDVWVTEIAFTKQAIDMKVGDTLPLENVDWTVAPVDADYKKSTVQWSTSDPEIVAITEIGANDSSSSASYQLLAVHEGTATISAHIENAFNEVTGSFTVTVTEHGITGIKFAKSEYTKKIGNDDNELKLYFKVEPYDIPVKTVKSSLVIESSDRNIVDVSKYNYDEEEDDGGTVIKYSKSKNMYYVVVECVAPGSAKITVSSRDDDKVKGKTKVTATAIAVKKVKLPKKSMKLFYYYVDDQHEIMQNYYKIQPKIQPSNAWYNVTWETSNAGVAFVKDNLENTEERGVWIVATGAGEATITMNVDDGNTVRQAKMKITVVTKTVDLKLNKKKATIKMIKGKDNTLQLEAFDSETEYDIPVKWTSSNKKVATVDKNGLVTAKKAGTAVITATTKDGNKTTATCNITVVKKEVTSLSAKGEITLAKKETKQLKVKVKPSDAYDTSLSYKSSNEKVVTVDSKGLLTAVGAGEATITVKTKDGTKLSLEITVIVK